MDKKQTTQAPTLTDKDHMETLLNTTKGACDLYLHGTIESATKDVHSTMSSVLSETLSMQNDIYTQMSNQGWYPTQNATKTQINAAKGQFTKNS